LDGTSRQIAGDAAMNLTAKQRRALLMLATAGRNGVTQSLLTAHGFGVSIKLVNKYFLTDAQRSKANTYGQRARTSRANN
jgi:hypothetical protein